MHVCDNCKNAFPMGTGLITLHNDMLSSGICDSCLDGARIIKVVLQKGDVGRFDYSQYQAIEMQKAAKK